MKTVKNFLEAQLQNGRKLKLIWAPHQSGTRGGEHLSPRVIFCNFLLPTIPAMWQH